MEQSKKTWDNQEKKKMLIKIGGSGIGGAVVLLGGALATAALASAFIVRKNGQSSGKDRCRRRHQSPPPEIKKQNERDKHPSSGSTEEVESDNDTDFVISTQMDSKESEQILCSICPEKLEKDAVSDGSVITEEDFLLLDENLPSEPQNVMHEDEVKIQFTDEDISNEISKEIKNLEPGGDGEMEGPVEITEMQPKKEKNNEVCSDQDEIEVAIVEGNAVEGVHINQMEVKKELSVKVKMEKKELEGFCSDNGEIGEEKYLGVIERSKVDLGAIVSERHCEDGLKGLLPMFESRVLPVENVKIIQDGGAIDGSEEVQVKYIEEELIKEHEECDQPDEGIVPEKCDPIEVKEDDIICENKEENVCILHQTPESREDGVTMLKEELISPEDIEVEKEDGAIEKDAEILEMTSMHNEDDGEKNMEKEIKEELISLEDIQVTKEDGANEDVDESLELKEKKTPMQCIAVCQPKDSEDDDPEGNIGKEVEEELISPENIEVTKEDITNEDVAESVEVKENNISMQFVVDQPEEHEDDVERNIVDEVEDLCETTDGGTATEKDDQITEMNEDEEKGKEKIEDLPDETFSSESPQESSIEPQQLKLINQEVEGKVLEDRAVKKVEPDSKDSQINGDDSSFEPNKLKAEEKTFIKKYVVELARLKDHPTNSTRRRMLIGTLSVLSSLTCSWFFGLSSVKLCLIVLLTMVLSSMTTAREDRSYQQKS